MRKETLDKLRRYIDLTATHSSLSTAFPMGRWPEHEAEREQAWQEFIEAAHEERIRQELLKAALADPEFVTAAQKDMAIALRRTFENLIGGGQE